MSNTAKTTLIHDYTQGPLFKQLVLFAIPFMASNAMQVLYSIVDMAVVGHYVGKSGLAAVSIASQTFTLMTMLCAGMSQGGQVYLAQLLGSGHREALKTAIGTMFTMLLGAGFFMMILGLTCGRVFLKYLNTPDDAFDDAMSYTFVCSLGIVFAYGYNIVSAVMRGLGDSRHPFIFILIASVLNLLLDLLFVAVFHWGVFGAGLATILGQGFSFLYALWFLCRHSDETGFSFSLKMLHMDKQCAVKLLKLGLPMACRFSIINFSMLFVISMVNKLGTTATGTFGAGIKLDDIANKLSLGIMAALIGIVAQNYGARNIRRIRIAIAYTWLLSSVFYAVFAGALWFYPEQLFSIFSKDEDVLDCCHVFVRAIIWTFPGLLLMKGTNGLIHGTGSNLLALCFGIIDGCVLRIGLSWFLGSYCNMGFYGYVLGYGLSPLGSSIPGLIYMIFAPWEKRKLATE